MSIPEASIFLWRAANMYSGAANGALLACCGLNLVVAASLWTSARETGPARRLALALAVLTGMMLVYPLGWTGKSEVSPSVAFFPFNIPLALGPLLHSYVTSLATGKPPRRELLHFVPAAILLAYLLVSLGLPAELRAEWKDSSHDKWVKPFIEAAVLVSLGGYGLASLALLGEYRSFISNTRSDADRFATRWIRLVLVGLMLTLCLLAAARIYSWTVGELDGTALMLWLAVLSAWLAVEGWRQSDRRYPAMQVLAEADSTSRDWSVLGERWREQTEAAGWWRDEQLTLADLARHVGTNSGYLSRAINDGLGINFNEMINRMRALEVARRIDSGTADNLTRAALEAGFSSKATFNRAFRAACGMSPSEWRRRIKS